MPVVDVVDAPVVVDVDVVVGVGVGVDVIVVAVPATDPTLVVPVVFPDIPGAPIIPGLLVDPSIVAFNISDMFIYNNIVLCYFFILFYLLFYILINLVKR